MAVMKTSEKLIVAKLAKKKIPRPSGHGNLKT